MNRLVCFPSFPSHIRAKIKSNEDEDEKYSTGGLLDITLITDGMRGLQTVCGRAAVWWISSVDGLLRSICRRPGLGVGRVSVVGLATGVGSGDLIFRRKGVEGAE